MPQVARDFVYFVFKIVFKMFIKLIFIATEILFTTFHLC